MNAATTAKTLPKIVRSQPSTSGGSPRTTAASPRPSTTSAATSSMISTVRDAMTRPLRFIRPPIAACWTVRVSVWPGAARVNPTIGCPTRVIGAMIGPQGRTGMKLGVIVPQGWVGEYDGWDPLEAWRRTVRSPGRPSASASSRSGCSTTSTRSRARPTRSRSSRSRRCPRWPALTERVRLGHIVICTAFRNPALTAKMISTMDSISGGRMELGIGAGWKRDEWEAYGYGFPETAERLARLRDDLGVITEMLAGDRHQHATFSGEHARVEERTQRAQADPAAASPDHGRRQRPERHLAARRALRRRAERRRDDAGRGRGGAADDPAAVRGDRP